jgi:hypothetical protein
MAGVLPAWLKSVGMNEIIESCVVIRKRLLCFHNCSSNISINVVGYILASV